MALKGADLLLYPTAIGWIPSDSLDEQQKQLEAWSVIQRGHAIANGLPLLCCNRVGFESSPNETHLGLQFWGHSFISGPQGEILAQAGEHSEVITAELNQSHIENIRRTWPFFRDRRVDAYQSINTIFDDKRETV